MGFTDLFVGEVVTELLKQLIVISQKCIRRRSSALLLIDYMEELLPIILGNQVLRSRAPSAPSAPVLQLLPDSIKRPAVSHKGPQIFPLERVPAISPGEKNGEVRENLLQLPSSICRMHTLKSLSITNCDSIQELPFDLGGIKFLQILRLHACPNLRRLPSGAGNLVSSNYLDISQCVNMEGLPEGMGGCTSMEKIDTSGCPKMKNLPASLAGLQSLRLVTCDEDVSWLWIEMKKIVLGPSVHVPEECFTLDWLIE